MKKDLRFEKVFIYENGTYKVGNDLAVVNIESGFPFLGDINMYSSLSQDIVVTFLGENGFNETKTLPSMGEITIPRDSDGYTIFSLPNDDNVTVYLKTSSSPTTSKEVKISMQASSNNLYFAKVDPLYYIEIIKEGALPTV